MRPAVSHSAGSRGRRLDDAAERRHPNVQTSRAPEAYSLRCTSKVKACVAPE
jgi:hypothetical protein